MQFFNFIPHFQPVAKGGFFVIGVAENGRRVVSAHKQGAVFVDKFAVLAGDPKVLVNQPLGGNAPYADHQPWANDLKLLPQPMQAGLLLLRLGVPVFRRAALDHIGNVHILLPAQVNALQKLIQQLAGATYKGLALQVLVLSRSFAD